MTELC